MAQDILKILQAAKVAKASSVAKAASIRKARLASITKGQKATLLRKRQSELPVSTTPVLHWNEGLISIAERDQLLSLVDPEVNLYNIVDGQTGKVVGKANTFRGANNSRDKRDLNYGAVRFKVEESEHLKGLLNRKKEPAIKVKKEEESE